MFDVKKFVAYLAFHDPIRELFFDMAEARGINSRWDMYHVLANEERVPPAEVEIMSEIYESRIKGNLAEEELYNKAIEDFQMNLRKKITDRLKG